MATNNLPQEPNNAMRFINYALAGQYYPEDIPSPTEVLLIADFAATTLKHAGEDAAIAACSVASLYDDPKQNHIRVSQDISKKLIVYLQKHAKNLKAVRLSK
jgi:hypothetical protein